MEAILHLFNSIFFSKKISIQDLIQNQGLKHIAEEIIGYLDAKSLANCRLVSKSWRDLVENGKIWWILQLQDMMTKQRSVDLRPLIFLNHFPPWKEVIEFFASRGKSSPEMTRQFCRSMEFYLNESDDLFLKKGMYYYFDPLTLAIQHGDIDFIECILQCPFDFNCPKRNWRPRSTPFLFASLPGYETTLCLLLDYAAKWRRVDLNKPDHFPAFFEAAEAGNANALALFICHANNLGINFRGATDLIGNTFLHIAVDNGHVDLVEMLLENAKKLDINVNAPNLYGDTPLHVACGALRRLRPKLRFLSNPRLYKNMIKIVELMLWKAEEHSFDLNATTNHGITPLQVACKLGNCKIAWILKKNASSKGIDCDAMDDHGQTALDYARVNGNAELIKILQHLDID